MSDQENNQNKDIDPQSLQSIKNAIQALTIREQVVKQAGVHKFWQTQPVLQPGQEPTVESGPIETKTVDEVRKTGYPLPKGFYWTDVDLTTASHLDQIYELLANNYVEDDDCRFRFNYSREFLSWALMPPGYKREWHLCVRRATAQPDGTLKQDPENDPLVGFITAIPATLMIHSKDVKAVEVNFLCVHKTLRSKRLAPVLIKEITRRVNLHDIWQATYTAGVEIPTPVSRSQYFHRSINPKKLIDIGFSSKPRGETIESVKRRYQLPNTPKTEGIRLMTPDDVDQAYELYKNYQNKFYLYQSFTKEEFAHFLTPRDGVIATYVVEKTTTDETTGEEKKSITDFTSFYFLPSSVFGVPNYDMLYVTYSYYNVASATPFDQLMNDALILAKTNHKTDVVNILDLMDNRSFLKDLLFVPGDGILHYYLYNWQTTEFNSEHLGLVLM